MHRILLKIGPVTLYSYGLFVALGFIVGILLSLYYARKEKINPEVVLDLSLYVFLSSILGARIFYVIGQWNEFKNNLVDIIMIQKGGLVFLGGFLAALLTLIILARVRKLMLFKLLDLATPGVILGYSIGRIGCFLNGCCFGLPTTLPWGVTFPPDSLAGFSLPGKALHPTQLYASFLMFFAFLLLTRIYLKKKFDGQIFFWGLTLYASYRFLIEFLRYSPIHWLSLTPSQWLALIIFCAGLLGLTIFPKYGSRI